MDAKLVVYPEAEHSGASYKVHLVISPRDQSWSANSISRNLKALIGTVLYGMVRYSYSCLLNAELKFN